MKTVFFAHGGSDNHGCEAIVRSTVKLLGGRPLLSSYNPLSDEKYGVDDVVDIVKTVQIKKSGVGFLGAYTKLKLFNDSDAMERFSVSVSVNKSNKNDVALSIGGDNYCYADYAKYIMLHDMYKKRGLKTVLWGCSVEPSLLDNPSIAADIARFDLITARETLSFEALKAVNKNTVLVTDPAFVLNSADVSLPAEFVGKDIVGINISPLIIKNEVTKGIAFENYRKLCKYILESTEYSVMLLPHVVVDGNDDRVPLQMLYNEFSDSGRMFLVEDRNCEQLKGYIAKCRFFVAARTHASIAAYSQSVPTLVIGYSVKARGIAKDIFGSYDGRVLPVQQLSSEDELTNAFTLLCQREAEERCIYSKVMEDYVNKAYIAKNALTELIGNE